MAAEGETMKRIGWLLLIVALMVVSCKKGPAPVVSLQQNQVFCIGDSEAHDIFYKMVMAYDVNDRGEVFISNFKTLQIDRYDLHGEYQNSIGTKGEGPAEFSNIVSVFAGTEDKVLASDLSGKLLILTKSGDFVIGKKLAEMGIDGFVRKMRPCNGKFVIYYIHKDEYWIAIVSERLETIKAFSTPVKARRLPTPFESDLDVDDRGRIYVTDNYEYAIHVYDLNGNELTGFGKDGRKTKIERNDFYVYSDNEVYLHSGAKKLDALERKYTYFPCITGINIDRGRIFVWRTDQTPDGESLVDVYDEDWHYIHELSCVNSLAGNMIRIVHGKLFVLSAREPMPAEIARRVGRFGKPGLPDQLCVYAVPDWVY